MTDNIPILHISTLVEIPKPVILSAKPLFPDEPITYRIIEYYNPNSASISKIANNKYLFQSNSSGITWIKYTATQNTSSPTIEVEIDRKIIMFRTYTQQMVNEIPKTLGTYTFDNVSFDGNTWKFGTISSNFFHLYTDQGPDVFFWQDSLNSIFQLGNMILINNASSNQETPFYPLPPYWDPIVPILPFPYDPLNILGLNIYSEEVQQKLINWKNQSPFRSWRIIILPDGVATMDINNFRLDIFINIEDIIVNYILPHEYFLIDFPPDVICPGFVCDWDDYWRRWYNNWDNYFISDVITQVSPTIPLQ